MRNGRIKQITVQVPFKDNKGELIPYLEKVRHRINFLDYDWFIVVCGKERRGKSTLAAQLGWFISEGKLTVAQICLTIDQFLTALRISKPGDVIIFDEGGTNLYSREAMSRINRMLTKAFMVSGLKNVCIIICIPSFFSLDTYIRTHRIDLLFYIPKRGKFKVYSTRRAKYISIAGSKLKKMEVTGANLLGWFKKQFPKSLEEEYRKKERKYKLGYIKEIKDHIEGTYTTTRFCEVTGFCLRTVMKWIEAEKIKARKIGGRWFIPKKEAERIVIEEKEEETVEKKEQSKGR